MDKYRNTAASAKSESHDAASVAAGLQDDFMGLIAIFDRHLARPLDMQGQARTALFEAKSAAQRGLDLSQRLVCLLQGSQLSRPG